jgi:NarL family two-component system response regulator LiaR
MKDASPREILGAIRSIHKGEPSMAPAIAQKLVREVHRRSNLPLVEDPLTERELEVLTLVAQGLGNRDIAERLVISERTASTHVSNILSKLHLANRTQAALYAWREGVSDTEP